MRIFITKTDTNLKALGASLLRKPAEAGAALDRLRALNPQVEDFESLAAGTVLVLPDAPEISANAGTPVGADHLGELMTNLGAGLEAIGARTANRLAELKSDRAAVTAALRTAAAKRLVESDPALREQIEAADAQFKDEQKRAAENQALLSDLQTAALTEFARLQKLL